MNVQWSIEEDVSLNKYLFHVAGTHHLSQLCPVGFPFWEQ